MQSETRDRGSEERSRARKPAPVRPAMKIHKCRTELRRDLSSNQERPWSLNGLMYSRRREGQELTLASAIAMKSTPLLP
jgi:hypothetical protein